MDGPSLNRNPREQAICAMFRPPALQFSRMLRSELDREPEYLTLHEGELLERLGQLLREAGIPVQDLGATEDLRHVLWEVVVRLRSYEKG